MTVKKSLVGALVLASAAGGPYVLFETDAGSGLRTGAAGLFNADSGPAAGGPAAGEDANQLNGLWGNTSPNSLPEMPSSQNSAAPYFPIHALQQVLRFDVTPSWVLQSFPQVTTVVSEMQLDGLRVPLVTGTTPSDMAGTLTYYFDRYQRVQRIQVQASTGDPSRFIAELRHAYQFRQEPSLGGTLYLRKWNNQPTSLVYATPASVVRTDAPYGRYNLVIELNQPGLPYGLSRQAEELLASGRQSNRWQ